MQSFSSKHKLHLFDPPVYEIDCFNTDQVMSKSCLLSFSFQIYFESSVSFEYLLWLKDLMWFLYRSLNVLAVIFAVIAVILNEAIPSFSNVRRLTYCLSTKVKENAIKWQVQKALVQLNCKLFLKSNYCIRNQKHSVKMQDYSFHQRTTQSGLLSCNTGPV